MFINVTFLGLTIDHFYGDKPVPDEDEDMLTVIKRRRQMAAKAAEEKKEKELLDRLQLVLQNYLLKKLRTLILCII